LERGRTADPLGSDTESDIPDRPAFQRKILVNAGAAVSGGSLGQQAHLYFPVRREAEVYHNQTAGQRHFSAELLHYLPNLRAAPGVQP